MVAHCVVSSGVGTTLLSWTETLLTYNARAIRNNAYYFTLGTPTKESGSIENWIVRVLMSLDNRFILSTFTCSWSSSSTAHITVDIFSFDNYLNEWTSVGLPSHSQIFKIF